MDKQNTFVTRCMANMTEVLLKCNQNKDDCVCSVQVSYVNDKSMPESMRYRTSIYCAKKGDDPFHSNSVENLDRINRSIDVMNKSK